MDGRTRYRVLAVVVVVAAAALGAQAVTAPDAGVGPTTGDAYTGSGETLLGVQSFDSFGKSNGKAIIVDETGAVVWEYQPTNGRVFDVETLEDGRVLLSVAETVPSHDCPPQFQETDRYADECVHNRVIEVDRATKDVLWEYDWYDAFIHWHEVHDADRLPTGETAIIDMGDDRAFTVDRQGQKTWEWNASEHLTEGTTFWNEYVPAEDAEAYRRQGPESDWTHMNDIDRLEGGLFQLSIRNYDVVITVDPETGAIVDVVGRPGAHDVMREQHNPHRLERHGTMVIADSENDRVVEIDTETHEPVWLYEGAGAGGLRWPRDADRLPNGNTLVTDSLNFRVIEVDTNGTVVWQYSLADERGIIYEADRLGVPEEPGGPSGRSLAGDDGRGHLARSTAYVERFLGFVFPLWFGVPELLTAIIGLLAAAGLGIEYYRQQRD